MAKAQVFLVDDSADIRKAVRPLFDSHPNFKVRGEAEHGREAVEKAPDLRPDLIVLDLSMPRDERSGGGTHDDQDPAECLDHTFHIPRFSQSGQALARGGKPFASPVVIRRI